MPEIVSLDDSENLAKWGFTETKCFVCFKTNAEIDGLLMQCARCKKVYYCSRECWHNGLEEHQKICLATDIKRGAKGSGLKFPEIAKKAAQQTAAVKAFQGGNNKKKKVSPPRPKSISIKVKIVLSGQTVDLTVQETDTVMTIKRTLHDNHKKDRVPMPSKQWLWFQGKELAVNGSTVKDCQIVSGSLLELRPRDISISVATPSGKTVSLKVSPVETVVRVKERMQKESGIPVNQQSLSFNGKELEDNGTTLASHGVEEGSQLELSQSQLPISVECPDGRIVTMNVLPTDSIDQIQQALAKESGIPVSEQKLSYQGKDLTTNPTATVQDCGIKAGAKLKLEPRRIPITVETPDGKSIMLEVEPSDTVAQVKQQVARQSGIPAADQKLSFNGQELADDRNSMKDCGVKPGSKLQVKPRSIPITVETPDGKSITLEVEPNETVAQVKQQIAKQSGIPAAEQKLSFNGKELSDDRKSMKDCGVRPGSKLQVKPRSIPITVETPDGKSITLDVEPNETVSQVKQQIAKRSGIPAAEQKLSFNGKKLSDDRKSVKDCGVKPGSKLQVKPRSIPITVETPDGKSITLDVEPNETVAQVKQQIASKTGIPATDQKLSFNGQDLKDDGSSMKDCGVKPGSKLQVKPRFIPITIRHALTGESIQLPRVDPETTTVEQVEKAIAQTSPSMVGNNNNRLLHQGKALPIGNKTLESLGITKPGSVIELEPQSITVSVQTPDGETVELEVDPNQTVDQIKQQIASKVPNLTPDRQKLMFNKRELSKGSDRLRDCGIQHGSKLAVEMESIPIKVKTPGGKVLQLSVDPADTMEAIKEKIASESGIARVRQRLLLPNGQSALSSQTVQDCGVQPGATLTMELDTIPISVKTPNGKTLSLLVEPTVDTVASIKQQLESKGCGIPPDQQRLIFAGNELDQDNKTVQDCKIRKNSVLKLEPKSIAITVSTPDGKKTVSLSVDPKNTTIDQVKAEVEKEVGIPAAQQKLTFNEKELTAGTKSLTDCGITAGSNLTVQHKSIPINVRLPNGTTVALEIDPNQDTVESIKSMLSNKVDNLPASRQKLSYQGNELKSGLVKVPPGATLDLEHVTIPITVKAPNNSYQLNVEPRDTIDSIKQYIAQQEGIPVSEQRLTFGGKELDGASTVQDCGIRKNSTLKVEPTLLNITVETPDGKKLALQVKLEDSVNAIKAKIAKESGISDPKLFFNDRELDNGYKTVKDCGIQSGSNLKVEPSSMPITVATPSGRTITLDVSPKDTVGDIKAAVAKHEGIAPEDQNLTFKGKELTDNKKTLGDCGIENGSQLQVDEATIPITVNAKHKGGTKITMNVKPSNSIDDIKAIVAKREGMAPERQKLYYQNKELSDGKSTVKSHGIKAGAVLDLEPFTIPITVESTSGNILKLDVEPGHSIADIKAVIAKQEGIPVAKQCLTFAGKELKDDSKTIADCGIKKDSVLQLAQQTIPISVTTPSGKTVSLDVSPSDKIGDIKAAIAKKEGIPAKEQRIYFNGDELKDDKKTVEASGIEPGSKLEVHERKFPINVKTHTGKEFTLQVDPDDSIDQVKAEIAKQAGMPLLLKDVQVLLHGKVLREGTVAQNKIKAGATLMVVPKPMEIHIATPRGKMLTLQVSSTDKLYSIKAEIKELEGHNVDRQVLFFKDEELEVDSKSLSDYGIEDGATLRLERSKIQEEVIEEKPAMARRKKCYMWYSRLGCPSRKVFKEKIKDLPATCEITPEDVDLLPWGAGGFNLNVRKMNELFADPEFMDEDGTID